MQLSAHCLWAQVTMQAAVVERMVNFVKVDTIQALPFRSHYGMQFELDTPCADLTHVNCLYIYTRHSQSIEIDIGNQSIHSISNADYHQLISVIGNL